MTSNSNSPELSPVSTLTAEHYVWGNKCDGWHLLRHPCMSVIQETMPPGTVETPHFHERSRQFFFVLEGSLTLSMPHGVQVLTVEHGIEIAPQTVHQARNDSPYPVRFLVISVPPSHGDRVNAAPVP